MILSYARVSTYEQAAEGTTSIAEQERRNRIVASMRGAGTFDFVTYTDEGVSGAIPLQDRPGGKALLSAAKAGDVVVAVKLDRLFRSAIDALQTSEALKKRGVDLILIDIGIDPVSANGAGKLFFGILAQIAEFERERIAERMADGKRAKRGQHGGAGHAGGPPPYGFKVVGEGREARLERNEDEEHILRKVAELSEHYSSPWVIGKKLTEQGFHDRAGNIFRVPQVKRLMERAKHV